MKKGYRVIGLMSGTSLDGLDLAACVFEEHEHTWTYRIEAAETIVYSESYRAQLASAHLLPALDLQLLHVELGQWMGKATKRFAEARRFEADFVASHGHTIFHRPDKAMSTQIGSGAHLAAASGYTTICDFRSTDLAHGGQGAPLVPIGDELLFSNYDYCLNLGGIANVSFTQEGKRVAFDISLCNILLNALAGRLGRVYDENGDIARKGQVITSLLDKWNSHPFFQSESPKSLGREFFETHFKNDLSNDRSVEDLLATSVEHIAVQIAAKLNGGAQQAALVTGGGAFNSFLIERIQSKTEVQLIVPDALTIGFKEALIFGFLGVLRMRHEHNALSSVTGAMRNSCGGAVYLP